MNGDGLRVDFIKPEGPFCKRAGSGAGGRAGWPRGALGLDGPRAALWTAGWGVVHRSMVDRAGAWWRRAAWPRRRHGRLCGELAVRRCGAREATPRAWEGRAGRGEADERVGEGREWPGRRVREAGRLGGGRTTPARARARLREGG